MTDERIRSVAELILSNALDDEFYYDEQMVMKHCRNMLKSHGQHDLRVYVEMIELRGWGLEELHEYYYRDDSDNPLETAIKWCGESAMKQEVMDLLDPIFGIE